MSVFIVVPKNSGLLEYKEKALLMISADESKILEVRGEDVPFWVCELSRCGKKAIGLTGEDLYEEFLLKQNQRLKVIKKIAWKDDNALFEKPCLCLIGPKGKNIEDMPKSLTVAISNKYRNIASKYLQAFEKNGFSFKKLYMKGCVEISCTEGIADLVIDIVYSGSSIARNNLCIYDTIMKSDFLIIGGQDD